MALSTDNVSMALFCDFENVALGVRDASYDKFDIKRVLERLLLKGSIVVKKAYCDWERYKGFKATMHEANFELIEIPHVRQSGKNSADIRLVVDALDLCYTKSHVNTFVIISGDSDFSPLVSKLRENAKYVIGVGVKQSTSDLLIANCDEFIFYDDLVRDSQREAARREAKAGQQQAKRSPEEEGRHREEKEKRKQQALDLAVETFEALAAERGDSGKIWASVLKEAIKRRKPDFNETYYGFRAFGNLLEEAQARGLLEFGRDEKSGAYVFRSDGGSLARADHELARSQPADSSGRVTTAQAAPVLEADGEAVPATSGEGRRRGRNSRGPSSRRSGRGGASHDEASGDAAAPTVIVEAAPASRADALAPAAPLDAADFAGRSAELGESAEPAKRPAEHLAAGSRPASATSDDAAEAPRENTGRGRRKPRAQATPAAASRQKARAKEHAPAADHLPTAVQAVARTQTTAAGEEARAGGAETAAQTAAPAAKPRKAATRPRRPRKTVADNA